MALLRKLSTGDVVIGYDDLPGITSIKPHEFGEASVLVENTSFGDISRVIYSPINNSFFISSNGSTGLYKVDADAGVSTSPSINLNNVSNCDVSPDETLVCISRRVFSSSIATNKGLEVYNTSTLSPVSGVPTNPTVGTGGGAVFSPDGQFFFFADANYNIVKYKVSDWSLVTSTPSGTASQFGAGMARSHTPASGNYIATWAIQAAAAKIWDATTNAIVFDLTTVVNAPYKTLSFGHTSNEILAIHSFHSGSVVSVIDITTSAVQHIVITGLQNLDYRFFRDIRLSQDGLSLYICTNENVQLHKRATLTSPFDGGRSLTRTNIPRSVAIISGDKWEVNGNIDENVAESQWLAQAYDLATGAVVSQTTTSTTTFKIPVLSPDPLSVTVRPVPFNIWKKSTTYSLNTKIYPTNPESTPYYYKCTTAGTSGVTEPTWPVTTNSTVTDGSVVWEVVERIIQPITHAPLIPTVVT